MDIVEKMKTTNALSIFDQFARMILGVTAGFVTTKVVEGAYDKYVIERRNTTEVSTETE